jgi:hypothetical protein
MKSNNQTVSMFCSALAEISLLKDEINTDVLVIVLRNTPELRPWCFTKQELRAMVRILAGDPANDRMSRTALQDLLMPPAFTTTSKDDKNRSIIPDEAVTFSTAVQAATSIDDGQDREDNAGDIELTRQVDFAGTEAKATKHEDDPRCLGCGDPTPTLEAWECENCGRWPMCHLCVYRDTTCAICA